MENQLEPLRFMIQGKPVTGFAEANDTWYYCCDDLVFSGHWPHVAVVDGATYDNEGIHLPSE